MKQKQIDIIRERIINFPAKYVQDKGVLVYALELFDNYVDDSRYDTSLTEVTEKDLLQGARDWDEYSKGGLSLIFDEEIAKRLYSPSKLKEILERSRLLHNNIDWMIIQANALCTASQIVIIVTNNAIKKFN